MIEQLSRLTPLVALELPSLTGRENRYDAIPVIGFEVVGGFDEDEADGAEGVDGGHEAVYVEDI